MSTVPELSARLAALMHEKSFSPRYIRDVVRQCAKFARFRESKGLQRSPLDIAAGLWLDAMRKAHCSNISLIVCRKAMERLVALSRGEDLSWTKKTARFKETDEYYESVSREIRGYHKWTSDSQGQAFQSTSRGFFRWLLDHDVRNFHAVRLEDVRAFYLEESAKVDAVSRLRFKLRNVCDFLRETGRINFDASGLFRLRIPARTRLRSAFDDAVLEKLVERRGISGPIELRDHAIVLLAASTGLRGVDIASLRLDSVDWRSGVISTVQRKTGVEISLPLSKGAGEAIRDYILKGRPETDSPSLFVRVRAPRTELAPKTLHYVFRSVCRRVGVKHEPGMGFHSFRRTLGRNLVRSGSGIPLVSQVLGHTVLSSSEHYIGLSVEDLGACALGFDGIRPEGRWSHEAH